MMMIWWWHDDDMIIWCWYDKRWASIGWPISGCAPGYGKSMTRSNPAESINHTSSKRKQSCKKSKLVKANVKKLGQDPATFLAQLSFESEWTECRSSRKVDFERCCLLLLVACCKSEVGNFPFLQRKVFNQISPNRWLTNSLLDKQRTLRILNMACCHIWIRKRWYPFGFLFITQFQAHPFLQGLRQSSLLKILNWTFGFVCLSLL